MRPIRFLIKRLFFLALQFLGVVTITFFLIRLLPGNPAQALAGIGASAESVAAIEERLGLDKPVPEQYLIYLGNLFRGDLGRSIFTGRPVVEDIAQRLPATLELVGLAMILIVVVGVPMGVYVAVGRSRMTKRAANAYGVLTGSIPDFWLGLILLYVFFFILRWAPPPLGRFDPLQAPPSGTGLYLLDSALSLNWSQFSTSARFLLLPVLTLVFVYMGNVVKQTIVSMAEIEHSDFIEFARASGLPERVILGYKLRNGVAPVVTVIAFTTGYLIGGAVLVESVFAWGGLGQYAVQAISNSDYAALTGFVAVVAILMSLIFLLLDIVYGLLDPRIWRGVR